MTSLSALVACASLVLSAQVDFQVDVKDSTRVGNSYTPGLTPSDLGNDYNFSEIFTPGAQMVGNFAQQQAFMLRYAPNLLYIQQFDNVNGSPVQPISVLHRVQANYEIGQPRSLKFDIGANFAMGRLDLSTFGSVEGANGGQVGTFAQSPTGQLTNYFGLNGYMGFEKTFNSAVHFVNQEIAGHIDSSNPNAQAATSGDPNASTGSINAATSSVGLQDETSIFSRNELALRMNGRNALLIDLQFSDIMFTGVNTYYGVTPQVGWEYKPSATTNLRALVGSLFFLQQSPGAPDYHSNVWALNFDFQTSFQKVPKLHLDLSLSVGPFYDLNYGTLEPRTQLRFNLSYDFTKKIHGQFGLRGVSGEYLDSSGWVPILGGRTKNMAIGNIQMAFNVTKWIQLNVGFYADIRTFQAASAGAATALEEYYGLVGFTGRWHTGGDHAAKPPTGGAAGASAGSSNFSPIKYSDKPLGGSTSSGNQ